MSLLVAEPITPEQGADRRENRREPRDPNDSGNIRKYEYIGTES